MYPQRELNRLAATKVALQRNIALGRIRCAVAASRVAQPLAGIDRMLAFWRRIRPLAQFAAGSLGLFVPPTVFPRSKMLAWLMRWGPRILSAVSGSVA